MITALLIAAPLSALVLAILLATRETSAILYAIDCPAAELSEVRELLERDAG